MITNNDIRRYSSGILGLLEREEIDSIQGIQKRLGESFEMHDGVFQLEARPSGLNPVVDRISITMSYIIQGKGIPIEIRLNVKNNYAFMIIKSNSRLEGYNPDFYDPLGHIIQSKRFALSFDDVKEELKRMSKK